MVTTSLNSQIDGFGAEIEEGDSTASDMITFTFSGQVTPPETDIVTRGFECTLDGEMEECPGVDTGEGFCYRFENLFPSRVTTRSSYLYS